jgi:recombination protein RecA
MGDSVMGVQARLMSQALRKITGAIAKSRSVVIFTNQLRMKIGVMFGNPETTPGGMALKFYSSIRLDSRKIETIKDGDMAIGSRHRVRVVKNKVAPPFRVAEFDILNDGGISKVGGLLDVGLELGLLTKKGAFIYHNDAIIGQGREAAKLYLTENPKVAKALEEAIHKTVKDGKKQIPKQVGEIETEE